MAKPKKDAGPGTAPAARLPKGFRDIEAAELRATAAMLEKIREVYERYGFEPLETPSIEYTDALGKFLPDQDRPNEGVFSFQDEDDQWLSLRYDLTAPLARYVAQNFQSLPKPFRRYATGLVYRNEKPGPGRFRQFTQFDADTVGTDSVAADAEICMLAADTLEALGIARGDYVVKVNNRKILDGVLESIGLAGPEHAARRLIVLRAIDKFDKFGVEGVSLLLGAGRKDESGDFTKGAELKADAVELVLKFLQTSQFAYGVYGTSDGKRMPISKVSIRGGTTTAEPPNNQQILEFMRREFGQNARGSEGIDELAQIADLVRESGYSSKQVLIDPSVVRGLEYYTGPVFEAELTFEVKGDDGAPVRFGSVGGGGRYDGLVERFLGQKVPATGFSIGVSRLSAALSLLKAGEAKAQAQGPVIVLVMDRAELPRYQRMTQELRTAGIRAEMYLGTSGMKAQMKYADKRGAPCVVIQGSDEREKGEVQIKDLIEGAKAAAAISDNKEWKAARPAQVTAREADLVTAVREIVERHRGEAL